MKAKGEEVAVMRCEYNDGLRVDYSGSLKITSGSDVNVFMKEGHIPADIKGRLDTAAAGFNCSDMRKIADTVRETVGDRACVH